MRPRVLLLLSCVCLIAACDPGSGGTSPVTATSPVAPSAAPSQPATIAVATGEEGAWLTAVTIDHLRENGISNYIGNTIDLDARLHWTITPPGRSLIPEDPTYYDTYRVSRIRWHYPQADQYIPARFRGQERGDVLLVSDERLDIRTIDKVDRVFFAGRELHAGHRYLLRGHLRVRSWLSPDATKREAFLRQTDDATYWSQTLEFFIQDVPLERR